MQGRTFGEKQGGIVGSVLPLSVHFHYGHSAACLRFASHSASTFDTRSMSRNSVDRQVARPLKLVFKFLSTLTGVNVANFGPSGSMVNCYNLQPLRLLTKILLGRHSDAVHQSFPFRKYSFRDPTLFKTILVGTIT